jgi:hypothetical protein
MTQAAFLITGSNGERASPVIRGAHVMDKLLHDASAPTPPNVPELSEASSEPKTNREMVKYTSNKPPAPVATKRSREPVKCQTLEMLNEAVAVVSRVQGAGCRVQAR